MTLPLDFCFATATELARRIRDREFSSADVTEAFLARIAAHNSKVNAIVHLLETDARARAKEADEALARGESWGPLHGVPVTIKEMFLIAQYAVHAQLGRFVGSHDVLLAPVSFGPAFKRCKQGRALDFDGALGPYNNYCEPYVAPFNASGHPVLVMPLGTSKDGLPIGVQLIGPYWSEPELLHIARQLAPLTKGFVPPQGF